MSVAANTTQETKPEKPKLNRYPMWAPRFWHGMRLGDWARLAWRNKTRFHPCGLGLALTVSNVTLFNSVAYRLQQMLYGRGVAETKIEQPPVFVIGHWRSGTTMLHELMVLDERFAYPTTYECFAPNHFLLTGGLFPKLLWFLLPSKRPMDNMTVSFGHPQEDEFALVSMGAPSPMFRIAFPNDPAPFMEFLDMQDVDKDDLAHWKNALLQFVRMQTYLKRKPVILKSPPHTGRIEVLSEMFPGAKFVHIVRDPYSLFASNRRLWVSLDNNQAFQRAKHKHLDEYVFQAFERMYGGFERQREAVGSENICDVHYEQLVQDPVGELRKIYEYLELGDFENVQPRIEEYAANKKAYKPNQHQLEPEIKEEVRRRWAGYFEKYGYE
ncbi:MAG: sulfotransferase family protein [Planctomycetaceae bacterium]|jgi:hypothetical protein|nr:sulfotransferase family protein [Planctomycetaceae bacterium]